MLLESKRCPAELGVTNLCKCFTGCTDCDIYVQLIEGLIENCLGHETWAAFKGSSHCSPPSARIIMRFTLNRSVEGRLPCIKHALPRCHGAISAAGVHYIYAYIYPTHTHTRTPSPIRTLHHLRITLHYADFSCRSLNGFPPLCLLLFSAGRLICYCCVACGLKKYFYLIYL